MERRDFSLNCLNHAKRVGANSHDDNSADGLPSAVVVSCAAANLGAITNLCDVAEPNRCPAGTDGHDTLFKVSQRLRITPSPQDVLAAGEFEDSRTHFRIGIPDRTHDLGHREPKGH